MAAIVPVLSAKLLAGFEKLVLGSPCDNVLLEHAMTLELVARGETKGIFPVLVGELKDDGQYTSFFEGKAAIRLPKVQVSAVSEKLIYHLSRAKKGAPQSAAAKTATVPQVLQGLLEYQGAALDNNTDLAVESVAQAVIGLIEDLRKGLPPQRMRKGSRRRAKAFLPARFSSGSVSAACVGGSSRTSGSSLRSSARPSSQQLSSGLSLTSLPERAASAPARSTGRAARSWPMIFSKRRGAASTRQKAWLPKLITSGRSEGPRDGTERNPFDELDRPAGLQDQSRDGPGARTLLTYREPADADLSDRGCSGGLFSTNIPGSGGASGPSGRGLSHDVELPALSRRGVRLAPAHQAYRGSATCRSRGLPSSTRGSGEGARTLVTYSEPSDADYSQTRRPGCSSQALATSEPATSDGSASQHRMQRIVGRDGRGLGVPGGKAPAMLRREFSPNRLSVFQSPKALQSTAL